jgi:hypothetical protein
MTNKERYKQAFSVLHTSDDFSLEVEKMAIMSRKNRIKTAAAAIIGFLALSLCTGGAYAANVGGIQRTIQLWVNGDQTTATLNVDETQGSYSVSYTTKSGEEKVISGGGISIDMFGNERPVSKEEIMDHLDMPEVTYNEDGTVYVYYREQAIDITDSFDDNGICYTHVKSGDKEFFMTIKYNGGYGIDTVKYPNPKNFN